MFKITILLAILWFFFVWCGSQDASEQEMTQSWVQDERWNSLEYPIEEIPQSNNSF